MCRNADKRADLTELHPHVKMAASVWASYSRMGDVYSLNNKPICCCFLFNMRIKTDRPSGDNMAASLKAKITVTDARQAGCAQSEDSWYKDILKRINPASNGPSTSSLNSFSSGR